MLHLTEGIIIFGENYGNYILEPDYIYQGEGEVLLYVEILKLGNTYIRCVYSDFIDAGNALERVQRVHEPADFWDITFCTR